MTFAAWLVDLDPVHSSDALLIVVSVAAAAAILYWFGLIPLAVRVVGFLVRGGIRHGFLVWRRLPSGATWAVFLAVVICLLGAGLLAVPVLPAMTIVCALASLGMGISACLAYTYIDLERYEVGRGYRVVHNPLKGQELAHDLVQYGRVLRAPLLAAAGVAAVGGFALLLRMNAASALRRAPAGAADGSLRLLTEDANLRIRLIAASALLAADHGDARVAAVVSEALDDPAARIRKGALHVIDSLGASGAAFFDHLMERKSREQETELLEMLNRILERPRPPAVDANPQTGAVGAAPPVLRPLSLDRADRPRL
jgi:hypothetical protein